MTSPESSKEPELRWTSAADDYGPTVAALLHLAQPVLTALFDEIDLLRDHRRRLREELAKHGWGDMHYSNEMKQDPAITALLEETQ